MLKNLTEINKDNLIVKPRELADIRLTPSLRTELTNTLSINGYEFNNYTGFAITDKGSNTKPANYALIPNQYLVYAAKFYEFALELRKYMDLFEKVKSFSGDLLGSSENIKTAVKNNQNVFQVFESDEDLDFFANFLDKDNDYYRLGSKRLINDSAVPRGSKDCFSSVILQQINLPAVSSSILGGLIYDLTSHNELYQKIRDFYLENENLLKQTSQNLATVFCEKTIGKFVLSFLKFIESNQKLSVFFDAIVEKNIELGSCNLELGDIKLTSIFKKSTISLNPETLISGNKPRFFESPIIFNNDYFYLSTEWTDGTDSRLDFVNFRQVLSVLFPEYQVVNKDDKFCLVEVKVSCHSELPKPFILLAGISGTGKTRFVREQAKLTGSLIKTYQLVSVRPDWHEPSDLFGYVSRLGSKPQYIATDFLKFIVNCWKAIEKAGISLSGGVAKGNAIAIQQLAPYWLCLDEMNLAPVEQYFADYLSVLETREWSWEDDRFTYTSAPLLKSLAFDGVDDSAMRQVLGLESAEDDALWLEIKLNGIGLPFNLIIAGTVNMDETTHGFSRKVLDRALAIDFGEFFPNDYAAYFVPTTKNLPLTYPTLSDGRNLEALANTIDLDGAKSIAFLNSINTVLAGTPFALAYRALNELLLAVICAKPSDEKHLQAVWDDFLMCKVLPRIEGDAEKLLVYQDANATHVLSGLNQALEGLLSDIWGDKNRPDLFRKNVSDTDLMVECRSRKKIAWMMNRLERTSFTSFWP